MTRKKFKVGDKVRAVGNNYYNITIEGWEGLVTKDENDSGVFYAQDPTNGNSPYDLESRYFELVEAAKPIITFKKTPGMNTLSAAAKALKRAGPRKKYKVTLAFTWDTEATDEDEAIELAEAEFKMKSVYGEKAIIVKTELINDTV